MAKISLTKYKEITNIPTRDELSAMKESDAKAILEFAKANHASTAIGKHWGVGSSSVYAQYYKYGIMEKPGRKTDNNDEVATTNEPKVEENTMETNNNTPELEITTPGEEPVVESVGQEEMLTAKVAEMNKMIDSFKRQMDTLQKENKKLEENVHRLSTTCLNLSLSGEFSKEELEKRIGAMMGVTSESNNYIVEFTLQEIKRG